MNSFEEKLKKRFAINPHMWRSLLASPDQQTLDTITKYNLFDSTNSSISHLISTIIPLWEHEACEGNKFLEKIIEHLENKSISHLPAEDNHIKLNLQRIRILAGTPGLFPFSPLYIQENLTRFLETSDVIADLPEFSVISFSIDEIKPLTVDLEAYKLTPHSRRWINNLFHIERREAILSVLAYISKNYPLLGTCRQAYALMLSLDDPAVWAKHPFCLRLVANRYWDYKVESI